MALRLRSRRQISQTWKTSGPAWPDETTSEEALSILARDHIEPDQDTVDVIMHETPKTLNNVTLQITGDVSLLCESARRACTELGYESVLLTDALSCEAREAGTLMADIAQTYQRARHSIAFIAGGETVVHVSGTGKGGRCQEMALAAAIRLAGCRDTCFFSIGSDGTDGMTDAAGGIVDESTARLMKETGIDPGRALYRNDSYTALREVKSLVMTGPTGTNVNDLSVLLIKR